MRFQASAIGRSKVAQTDRLVLDGVVLDGADFSGRRLLQFTAVAARFTGCSFRNMHIESASFGAGHTVSTYVNCVFDQTFIKFGLGGYSRFERCSFRGVEIRELVCFSVEMIDCVFSGVLRGAIFNGTVPEEDRADLGRSRNEFRGNDFSGADLIDVAFRSGIDLEAQHLPRDDHRYLFLARAERTIASAEDQCARWPDSARRTSGLALLRTLKSELAHGQRQLLLRKEGFASLPRRVVDAVFDLLQRTEHAPERG